MREKRTLFNPILIFVLAQLAWFLSIGLWIYRYVTNNMIFRQVSEQLPSQLISERTNILALVGGLMLMVSVSVAMSLIFRHLTLQLKITHMYDNFIANVTHELKSPLSSIQLYLETLEGRKVPRPKEQEFIKIMKKDSARLQNLIDTILNISGIEQKKHVFNFQVVSAGPAFRQLMEETVLQLKISANFVSISETAPCRCVVDLTAMRIVFNNLLDNAIKYSKDPPKINFNTYCTSRFAVLEFRDKGVGISHKDQITIFYKFHRIYGRDIPSVKGTGLGLYWVKEIIKTHGGRIRVHSEGIGKGSTFIIELPIYRTTRKRYINRLLKITQKFKRVRDESEQIDERADIAG
jgi:signal transduction histidine kinase